MCGIVGIYDFSNLIDEQELGRFTDSLAHRGPDGRGVYIDQNLGLGHRRLSILDTSEAGRNPMCYQFEDGSELWITFNGEIFNFLELKKELKELGYRFSSETDTEVILVAYRHWGKQCLKRFNGMWSFAIWDKQQRTLFLARDRFGIKPLYYSVVNNRFLFASEIKSFTILNDVQTEVNEALVPVLLNEIFSYEGMTNETVMKNVYKLAPGHNISINNDGKIAVDQWWNTADYPTSVPSGYNEQVEQFRELFLDSVKLRMRSDVKIGTSLSGGLDSSAVACSIQHLSSGGNKYDMSRIRQDRHGAFIVTYDGSELDEREYADKVINWTGMKPHYFDYIFQEKKDNYFSTVNKILDSVYYSDDIMPVLLTPMSSIYKKMRENSVVVTLDGHGGDELLFGYKRHFKLSNKEAQKTLYKGFGKIGLPGILKNFDRASMTNGVEIRNPFLDWRLVTYSFSLPISSRIGGGFTKRILRDAMKGIVPESIRTRKSKIGFHTPLTDIYNQSMNRMVLTVMKHEYWQELLRYKPKGFHELVYSRFLYRNWSKRDSALAFQVWYLLNLFLWKSVFVDKEKNFLYQ